MTVQISKDTVVLIGVVIVVFLLAMICLAFSLNPRELVDGSFFRCCSGRGGGCCGGSSNRQRRLRGRRQPLGDEEEEMIDEQGQRAVPYETLNEFIFEAEDQDDRPTTTMEQVFPDLLGGDAPPTPQRIDLETPLLESC
jgi:hypothetical protein